MNHSAVHPCFTCGILTNLSVGNVAFCQACRVRLDPDGEGLEQVIAGIAYGTTQDEIRESLNAANIDWWRSRMQVGRVLP